MADHGDILADRLNVEPAIFWGCSSSELGLIVGAATLLWLPTSLLLTWFLGAVTMGFGIAGILIVVSVLVLAKLFQRLKRNRPDGYYQQQIALWLDQRGWRRSPFIHRTGSWDLGRSTRGALSIRDR